MKKKTLVKFFLASTTLLTLAVGCNDNTTSTPPSNEVTIPEGNFVLDESKTETVDLGSSYYMDPITVKDSDNKYHKAVITVKDSSGKDYPVVDSSFTPDHTGIYTITYTITYGDNKSISKSYTINVVDLSAPVISSDFKKDNLAVLGQTIDLANVKVTDNSKEDITPTIKVTFNETEIELTDNKFVANEKGLYKVNVIAEDSSGNKLNDSFNIFTVVDGENDVSPVNQYYPMTVSETKSYNGSKSIQADWLSKNVCWVNDFSLLGSDFAIISEAQYLSFWVYFDSEAVGVETMSNIYKYTYYQTYCYDEFGNEVNEYYQFENSFDLANNKWYRLVFDLTDATNATAEGRECKNNPKSMSEIAFGFGIWDSVLGGNANKVENVYVDDIRLTNALDDEVYHKEVVIPPVESDYIADESKVTSLTNADLYTAQVGANGNWVTTNALVDYVVAHGNREEFSPLVTNSVNTLGASSTSKSGEEGDVEYANWRMFFNKNDGIVYAIKAKEHCFIKIFDDAKTLGGWMQGNVEYTILNADKTIKSKQTKSFNSTDEANGNLGTAFTELQKDETYLFIVTSSVDATRNIQNCPGISIAPAKNKNEQSTAIPDTENQVVLSNQYGLHDPQKNNSGEWITTNENADYTVGHGTVDNFSPLVANAHGFLGPNSESGDGEAGFTEYQTWRMFFNKDDGIIYAVKAKKHCFVKVQEQDQIGGWVEGNINIKVFNSENVAISTVTKSLTSTETSKGQIGCDYVELQEGQTFVWAITSNGGTRNLQYCPSLVIAPAK